MFYLIISFFFFIFAVYFHWKICFDIGYIKQKGIVTMLIKCEDRLSKATVISILERFDMSFNDPLHNIIDFFVYGEKLSLYAHFILAYDEKELIGFIAYYINIEGGVAYVPFVAVHPKGRHRGVGHLMFSYLSGMLPVEIDQIRLEVKESNVNALNFYQREGFHILSGPREGKYMIKT